MRVKRLEIQGFKSFKDKTVIHFDHSITGIVGPNGCGKSNIVDAFFWVMGEQSYKHMRGSGTDDLIFNGSSKYQPLGLAEATLVMETDAPGTGDNTEEPAGATVRDIPIHLRTKEISVTRRVYRTGEGEYFINGVPARLKDIKELFMDTGVGAKGYSVIEQGQIGKIVNSKPEERRLLIEEAAGIAKYKARKTESLRKMEATQSNLSRLSDIIQEIERNLGSLERQAAKARQYKKNKEELLDKEMTWGRRKTVVLRQRSEALKRQRDVLEQELAGLKAELQTAENGIEGDRLSQLNDTKLAEELQTLLAQQQGDLARAQSALDLSRRRQGDLTSQLQSLENEREELSTSILAEREKIVGQEVGSNLAQTEYENATQSALAIDEQAREGRRTLEQARRSLENLKRELMNGISQASEFTSRAAQLASRAESAQQNAARLAAQIEVQQARLNEVQQEQEHAQSQAADARARRSQAQAQVSQAATELQSAEREVKEMERQRLDADRALTKLRSRLQSLEELAAAHEGFGDGPKAALEWARTSGLGTQLRAIADSLQVSTGYEAALEGWLEGRLQSLVSDDASVALRALERIQGEKLGRAWVQVAPTENGDVPNAGFAQIRPILAEAAFEVLGELTEFVTATDSGAASLLNQVAVVRSMEPLSAWLASGASLSQLSGWSIVSVDGNACESSGLLRGGSTESDHSTSVLGRKRVIAELAEQVTQSQLALNELELKASANVDRQETSREKLHAARASVQELDIELSGLDRDVVQSQRALKEAQSQLETLEIESGEMQEESARAESDREATVERLAVTVSRRAELEAKITEDDAALQIKDTTARALEEELQKLRVSEASLRERASSLRRELEGGRSVLSDREKRLSEVVRILDRATKEHEEHSGGDQELEERIQVLTSELMNAQSSLASAKDRLESSSRKLNSTLDRIKELHSIGNDKTAESGNLALDAERVSGELTFLIQNLEEKYGPGCLERPVTSPIQEEMTEPVVTAEMTAEEEILLGEEVERIRERLRRLGEVNVMAIEEFEELKKRYDYLMTERTDLEHSIKNLQDAIEHINKTSEERFRKAFTAIAERFERLFPIIFGGGAASLTLVYPLGSTDILEAGVDIMAQPPGKKVSNITLLSGGEKALTAVSLIFAIFMVKPSPFCVLDEVDAPLDDANIGKFNALLKEMSAKSQFILITHNKKTMELNDTLYGVTMEEPGVSKMVSIEMH